MHCSYFRDPSFADTLQSTAKKLATDLGHTLWPLLKQNVHEGAGLPTKDPALREFWRDKEQVLEKIFTKSLNLQASLCLNSDDYLFFWPPPNAVFNVREMRDDRGTNETSRNGTALTVNVTLFPGVIGQDQESVLRNRSQDEKGDQARRVIVPALVLLN